MVTLVQGSCLFVFFPYGFVTSLGAYILHSLIGLLRITFSWVWTRKKGLVSKEQKNYAKKGTKIQYLLGRPCHNKLVLPTWARLWHSEVHEQSFLSIAELLQTVTPKWLTLVEISCAQNPKVWHEAERRQSGPRISRLERQIQCRPTSTGENTLWMRFLSQRMY